MGTATLLKSISYDHRNPDQGLNESLRRLFDVHEHAEHELDEVKAFIAARFAEMHEARIRHFMPRLLSLRSRGEMIAAFGLRSAAQSPLFLETYLDQPIEGLLQTRLGVAVDREQIVEVGHLSAIYPGAARWLIVAVTALLHREGFRWVVFTGTSSLRNGFYRLGLRPMELAQATLQHLPQNERVAWGRYYDNAPVVMAGDIAHGYQRLAQCSDLSQLLRSGIAPVEDAR